MPVDDTELESKRAAVSIKLNTARQEMIDLKNILTNIDSITMIQDPAFPTDPTKKIEPQDRGLGTTISNQRRQDVYDQVMIDVAAQGL